MALGSPTALPPSWPLKAALWLDGSSAVPCALGPSALLVVPMCVAAADKGKACCLSVWSVTDKRTLSVGEPEGGV